MTQSPSGVTSILNNHLSSSLPSQVFPGTLRPVVTPVVAHRKSTFVQMEEHISLLRFWLVYASWRHASLKIRSFLAG